MDSKIFAVLIQAFEHHNVGIFLDKFGIKNEFHDCFACGRFGRKDRFGTDFLAVNHKRLACGFIHQDALENILLAGNQVLVGYSIGKGEDLGRTDFLFAVYCRRCPDLRDAVVDHGDFDDLFMPGYGHGIDFLIREEGLRRAQLLDDPVSVRDLLKCEGTVRL